MLLEHLDRIRLEKAAEDEGFAVPRGQYGAWLAFDSLGAPAALRLTKSEERYLVATNHLGVVADLKRLQWPTWPDDKLPQPPAGFTAFAVVDTGALHQLVGEIWRLARTLPQAPLHRFEAATATLPRATDAERLVVQRVGQDIYRDALMDYWHGRCAITGLAVPELLRASHAKPWKDCETDAERLDVYNGLLLVAHLDAAFDAGLIAVAQDGTIIVSERLDTAARSLLGFDQPKSVQGLAPGHTPYLKWHRSEVFR